MNRHRTDQLERKARALYRQSCQTLPPQSRQALQKARLDALASRPQGLLKRMLVPAGAMAASALVLVIGWGYRASNMPASSPPVRDQATSTQLAESTDLYKDLEFYRWLATQDEQALARN
ncbi:MAG: hypothetical protein WCD66_01515 [Rhodanobacteraceae bacterium]